MTQNFDPYHKWLGIPPNEQPPNHYRLLALGLFESDPEVIDAAANRQMAYVQQRATGEHTAVSQKLLNELAAVRLTLLEPQQRAAYDAKLKAALAEATPKPHENGVAPDTSHSLAFLQSVQRSEVLGGTAASVGTQQSARKPVGQRPRSTQQLRVVLYAVGGCLALALLVILWAVLNRGTKPDTIASKPENEKQTLPTEPARYNVEVHPPSATLAIKSGHGTITGEGTQRRVQIDHFPLDGFVVLEASCNGYESSEQKLTSKAGQDRNVRFALKEVPVLPISPAPARTTMESSPATVKPEAPIAEPRTTQKAAVPGAIKQQESDGNSVTTAKVAQSDSAPKPTTKDAAIPLQESPGLSKQLGAKVADVATGIIKSGNVALAGNGTTVEGEVKHRSAINDGRVDEKWDERAKAPLHKPITLTFPEVYRLASIRIKLSDGSQWQEYYQYSVEVSSDGEKYETLEDRTKGEWRGWQDIQFSPRPVKSIRLTGTEDHPNHTGIRIYEIEAYCGSNEHATQPERPISGQEGASSDAVDGGGGKPEPNGRPALKTRLAGTKWVNSNKVTFEWTTEGRLVHGGSNRKWKVLDDHRVQLIYGSKRRDTLIFNDDLTEFTQEINGGPKTFKGTRQ